MVKRNFAKRRKSVKIFCEGSSGKFYFASNFLKNAQKVQNLSFLEKKGKIFSFISCPAAIGTTFTARFVVEFIFKGMKKCYVKEYFQILKSKENLNPSEFG